MCGIAGILGVPRSVAQGAAKRMLATMRRRGPDGQGMVELTPPRGASHPIFLLHTRLAIQDLTQAGHQPMADEPQTPSDFRNWIVFNGEVFNFRDIQSQLRQRGTAFQSRCDTEVILRAFRQWGESCVQMFRGMFAWCLVDGRHNAVWFCRDRLGIKPLYMVRSPNGGLLFASELRTLLAAGPDLVPPRVNPLALESYLAQGAVCGLDTIVQDVRLLGPGQSVWTDWEGRRAMEKTYWRIPFCRETAMRSDFDRGEQTPHVVRRIGETLRESIRLQLISDAPLGLFLSGGIDSGAIATLAVDTFSADVESVSIGFDNPDWDETEAAAEVAKILGTRHRTLKLTGGEVLADLPNVLAGMDQPTVDGFNVYFASLVARRAGLKAALSGIGGDELFGGYASFRDVPRAVSWGGRLNWMGWARQPTARLLSQLRRRSVSKMAEMLQRHSAAHQAYLLRRELFLPQDRRSLVALPRDSDPHSGTARVLLEELAARSKGMDAFNQVSLFETIWYLRHMLLRDADVFSMTHGLELRVPLLDHELVEAVASLHGRIKQSSALPKPLLVKAVGDRLPSRTYRAPKKGFAFPWQPWLRGPLKQRVERAVSSADVWTELGMDPSGARRLWRRFLKGDGRVAALQILALVVLEDFASRHGLRRVA